VIDYSNNEGRVRDGAGLFLGRGGGTCCGGQAERVSPSVRFFPNVDGCANLPGRRGAQGLRIVYTLEKNEPDKSWNINHLTL